MSQKIPWDKEEALILLDALLQVLSGVLPRKDAVASVSRELRMRAIHRGASIDDIFRNQNGIQLQMSVMECAYTDGKRGLKQHKVPELFQNVVFLYKNDQAAYKKYLAEAKSTIDFFQERGDKISVQNTPTDSGFHLEYKYAETTLCAVKTHQPFCAELLSMAEAILSSHFVNGMRKDSTIAKRKFWRAYLDLTGEEFPESIDIDELASSVGVEYANKFYAVSGENKENLRKLISTAVDAGNRVMFYEEIYQCHLDFMAEAGIFSTELLKAVLKQILPDMRYMRTSFSPNDDDSLEKDIIDCYGDEPIRTYEEIKEHLLYADLSQIRLVCSRSGKFVWAKDGTYALTERILLSKFDINCSLDTIAQDIERQGFSVFQRISVSESAELNPRIPEVAVREAIYVKHLAPLYRRNRSIITLPGVSFSASMVMVEYCKNLHEATLSELQAYEEELTDKSTHSLFVAYDTMIRVDGERFVSLDTVKFDIHAIDDALSLFVQGRIVPLKGVKSFTSFPEVDGYPWNLFLLDSFCRHKSRRFRTMGGPAKSKPVGAIFPVQMQFDNYDDLLAQVAAKSDLTLRADDVGEFFTKNAYTLRRIETTGIVNRAQEIRIQEGIANV